MELWSWVLMFLNLVGLYFISHKKRWGWLVCLATEPLWIIYSLTTEQYGFLVASVAYSYVYYNNYRVAARIR